MSNNKLFESEKYFNYIPGIQISTEEQELINKLINFKESDETIFNLFPCNKPIFKTYDLIKWHILIFEVITKNKKQYYKFEDDETLYSYNNNMSYIKLKKTLFLYFKRLLYLLNDSIEEDIIKYLANNFFNNINKCKYYKCLAWFLALFIFYFNSISEPNLYYNENNIKNFRRWWRNNIKIEVAQIKDILIKFNNICHLNFKDYEDLKIMLNFVIPQIADGWTKL